MEMVVEGEGRERGGGGAVIESSMHGEAHMTQVENTLW